MSPIDVVIDDYSKAAELALGELRQALRTQDLRGWRSEGVPRTDSVGGVDYEFHGSGVYIKVQSSGLEIEIEFGPGGQEGVFDSWRIWEWVKRNPARYSGFPDHESIKDELFGMFERGQLARVGESELFLSASRSADQRR